MKKFACFGIVLALASVAKADSLDGRWDASVTINGATIPFRLDISGDGDAIKGTLFNGDREVPSTGASRKGDSVKLAFEHYLTTIAAKVEDGALVGTVEGRFDRDKYLSEVPFRADRHREATAADASAAPKIAGNWEVPFESAKGEKSWNLIVKQDGAEVSASILRIDGDTGALTGSFKDGKFVLGHFSGSRPLRLEITPREDGTLELRANGAYSAKGALVAYRPEAARAKGLPKPSDPATHTTVKDPGEVFKFKFPDVSGKVVSSDDERFKNKVVVAVVTGTWCPNCHDEAQYLVELDRKYRDRGLEIVALDFEEPEQQDDLSRVKAFLKNYGVKYTYLIAGAPIEMWDKVPQAVNLNSWPTTFFVGRDGKVKSIHAGFAAPASGEFHDKLKADFTKTIERLLDESATASR